MGFRRGAGMLHIEVNRKRARKVDQNLGDFFDAPQAADGNSEERRKRGTTNFRFAEIKKAIRYSTDHQSEVKRNLVINSYYSPS